MSVAYRSRASPPLDPDDVIRHYRRGGWRLLDAAYARDDRTRQEIATIIKKSGLAA